jgi:hypothetical protein
VLNPSYGAHIQFMMSSRQHRRNYWHRNYRADRDRVVVARLAVAIAARNQDSKAAIWLRFLEPADLTRK